MLPVRGDSHGSSLAESKLLTLYIAKYDKSETLKVFSQRDIFLSEENLLIKSEPSWRKITEDNWKILE